MPVKKLDMAPKRNKVRKLTVKPVRKVNGFDLSRRATEDYEVKQLHHPANDEVIEIELTGDGLKMLIRPINSMVAQISFEPNGHIFEEEIYAYCWHMENDTSWQIWNSTFSNQVIKAWKKMTEGLK